MSLFSEARSKVKSLKYSELTKASINNLLNYFIFPCNYITAINNTDSGLKGPNAIRNRFFQWEALLPGNDTIFLNWEGATQLTQVDTYMKNHWEVKYNMETAVSYHVYLYDESGSTEFGTSDFGSFGTFASTYQENKIKLQMTTPIDLKMLTQFWLCPQISGGDSNYDDNQIYRIISFQNYKDNKGNFTYADVELGSINNELAQSGQAIQQKVKFASPGQGYAFPKLTFDDKGNVNGFTYNNQLSQDIGVKQIQVEVVGNAAIYGLEIYGYPLQNNDNTPNGIYSPRRLLVQDLRLPVQEDFFIVSNAENRFYYGDVKLLGTTSFNDWKERLVQLVGDKQMNYQGLIEFTNSTTMGTNAGNLTINDLGLVVNDEFLKTIGDSGKLPVQASQWFYDGSTFDSSTGKWSNGIGEKTIDLTNLRRKRFSDLLNIIGFATNYINLLPFDINSKVAWSLRDFYIIGGFLNKITFGFPIAWRQIYQNTNVLYPGLKVLPALINKGAYDFFSSTEFASNLNKDDNVKKIPLDIFQTAESGTLGAIFGNDSTTTSLNFTITDKALLQGYNKDTGAKDKVYNASTIMINQNYKYANNDFETRFKVSEETYSLDNRTIVEATDIQGNGSYVITGIGIRMLGDGDVRVTMYKDNLDILPPGSNILDSIIYQSIIKSQAGYRNSQIREWLTFQKMSWIEAMVQWDKDFTWPLPYPEPQPETELKEFSVVIPEIGKINSNETKEHAEGWFDDNNILIYDFSEKGFTTSQQVRDAYDYVFVPEKIINAIAITSSESTTSPRREKTRIQNQTTSISKSFSTIPDAIQPRGTFDRVVDANIRENYRWYANNHVEFSLYFEGTRLMLNIKTQYNNNGYKDILGVGSSLTVYFFSATETWFNGGTCSIVPLNPNTKKMNLDFKGE